jgi:hypothetical protein
MPVGRWGGKGDNARALDKDELLLIKNVFRTARLPAMMQISIADGVSIKGTAWTDSDYEINVGPGLYSLSLAKWAPSTLVHEMTHVWQYYNHTLTKAHAFIASVRNPEDDLYSYDLDGTWEDMGFEGQAQLVEDWYDMGMHIDVPRYVFIKHCLWSGDKKAAHLTRSQLEMRDLGSPEETSMGHFSATAQVESAPLTDSYLLSLLKPRFGSTDVPGFGARERTLEKVFASAAKTQALPLYSRLQTRKGGDNVSIYFHDHLSTSSRTKLLQILQNRVAGR